MKAINRHLGLDICRQNIKVDGIKQSPYIIPVLRKCAYSIKDAKRIIEEYKVSEVVCDICDWKGYLTDVYDTEAEETQTQRCDSCKEFESDKQAQEHVESEVAL